MAGRMQVVTDGPAKVLRGRYRLRKPLGRFASGAVCSIVALIERACQTISKEELIGVLGRARSSKEAALN